MSLAEIINQAAVDGVKLTLSPAGKVVVAGDKNAVNRWRPVLAELKAALLSFLGEKIIDPARQAVDFDKVAIDNLECALPKDRGTILEICGECPGVPEAVSIDQANEVGNTNNRQARNENATQRNDIVAAKDETIVATLAKKKVKPSPVALEWLKNNRDILRLAGWTARELYRRDKTKGLAWVAIWDKEDLKIIVKDDGVIVFQFQSATNQTITQTARPIKQKSRASRLKEQQPDSINLSFLTDEIAEAPQHCLRMVN